MTRASFNFHGVNIFFSAHDRLAERILKLIAEDFRYFRIDDAGANAKLEFNLFGSPAPAFHKGPELFKTRMCSVFGLGFNRVCDYGDGTAVETKNWSYDRRKLNIYSPSESELYEFTYVSLLSVVGEALDGRGLHRIHAVAVADSTSAFALLLPSGGGKSTLAATLLNSNLSLLSDESPLLKDGVVYPFPNHLALAPSLAQHLKPVNTDTRLFQRKRFPNKYVFNVPLAKVSKPRPLKAVFFGKKSRGAAEIKKIPIWKSIIPLFRYVVVGEGLAQMAEFMLRGNNVVNLIGFAFSRFSEATQILRQVPCYEFFLGDDRDENAKTLLDFICPAGTNRAMPDKPEVSWAPNDSLRPREYPTH